LSKYPGERFARLAELMHCREYIVGFLHYAYLQPILWLVDLTPFASLMALPAPSEFVCARLSLAQTTMESPSP
jgi:hypothetical protein